MNSTTLLVLIIIISIVVFLILREFVCWYFKINERKVLLEQILAELRILNKGNKTEDDEIYSESVTSKGKNIKEPPKQEETDEDEEEDIDPDELVEDPFWNKKK
ncbi:MAG: hypothetical protein K6C97_01600 [Treponema sp.]|nr:hypothetical protein [Treponema sp.]